MTMQAEIEIVETGERFTVAGYSIKEMIATAKKQAGEWTVIAVRAVAVLSLLTGFICTHDGTRWTCSITELAAHDVYSAGQTYADPSPFYKGAD